jgi:hypothetical protein
MGMVVDWYYGMEEDIVGIYIGGEGCGGGGIIPIGDTGGGIIDDATCGRTI